MPLTEKQIAELAFYIVDNYPQSFFTTDWDVIAEYDDGSITVEVERRAVSNAQP